VTSSQPAKAWRDSRTLCDQLAGAQEQARLQGFQIEEFPFYAAGMTPSRFNQVLWNRGIVGLIVAPLRNGMDTLPIDWNKFAAVGLAFSLKQPAIPRVGSDHANAVRLAIRECRARGYKRIGLALTEDLIGRVEEQWLANYLVEQVHPRAHRHPSPLIVKHWSKESFLSWFRSEKPDAIITGGDPESVIGWVGALGLRVPNNVGVVSLDLHVRDGSVAGINQYSEDVGAAVVNYLIGMLHRNERGQSEHEIRVHIMGNWVEGATVRPRRA
jgi:DNA-binding LacI/PurR family transcriptional regulator